MTSLDGTVLVTGGTGALGAGVVAELLDAGARVVSTWFAEGEDERARAEFGDRDFELVRADLGGGEGAGAAVAAAGGSLVAVVNLVGGFAAGGRVHEAPEGELERMLELNLMTAHRVCRAALPVLVARGGGAIVCVGTRAALDPFSGGSAYAVSKAALLALVRSLALEYRDDGVRANAILPSVIDTPANRRDMPDADHSRWVAPEEIGRVVAFLCSGDSAVVSGGMVPVFGGS